MTEYTSAVDPTKSALSYSTSSNDPLEQRKRRSLQVKLRAQPAVHIRLTPREWGFIDDGARFSLGAPDAGRRVFTTFVAFPVDVLRWSVTFLEEHLHRLRASAVGSGSTTMDKLPSPKLLRDALSSGLADYRGLEGGISGAALVRITADHTGMELFLEPYVDSRHGPIEIRSFVGERAPSQWKSTDAAVSIEARAYARKFGADEALLIDERGRVREGAWCNFFWFDSSGALFTAGSGVLPGITRQQVIRNERCQLVEADLKGVMRTAVEAFVTKSTTGITAVRAIDGTPLPAVDLQTARVRERFNARASAASTLLENGSSGVKR